MASNTRYVIRESEVISSGHVNKIPRREVRYERAKSHHKGAHWETWQQFQPTQGASQRERNGKNEDQKEKEKRRLASWRTVERLSLHDEILH